MKVDLAGMLRNVWRNRRITELERVRIEGTARIVDLESALERAYSHLRDLPKTATAVAIDGICADALGIERCAP